MSTRKPGMFESWSDVGEWLVHWAASGFIIFAAVYVLAHLLAPAIAIILSGAYQ